MNLSPFISYAREDHEFAKKLYAELQRQGVEPWLDSTKIVAGAPWPKVIEVAIWSASHVLLLISSRSVFKEGYVQREMHEALERSKNMPEERNFLIPVRLDECHVPFELRKIHHVDMFAGWDSGVRQIVDSLRASALLDSGGPVSAVDADLMTELKQGADVEIPVATKFGRTLQTRAEVYAEAVRLVANASIYDSVQATATLFNHKETTDELFVTYLNLIAAKCRDAADQGGPFEHHALFAFRRDAMGRVPPGVKSGLDIRQAVFRSHGVANRLHLYEIGQPMIDMLLVGRDRAIVAFPESPTSSRLLYGASALGLQSVESLVKWYEDTIAAKAKTLDAEG